MVWRHTRLVQRLSGGDQWIFEACWSASLAYWLASERPCLEKQSRWYYVEQHPGLSSGLHRHTPADGRPFQSKTWHQERQLAHTSVSCCGSRHQGLDRMLLAWSLGLIQFGMTSEFSSRIFEEKSDSPFFSYWRVWFLTVVTAILLMVRI